VRRPCAVSASASTSLRVPGASPKFPAETTYPRVALRLRDLGATSSDTLWQMNVQEIFALLRAHSRRAVGFRLDRRTTQAVPGTYAGALGSRVGGAPYLEEGEDWPVDRSGRPMHFAFQLDLAGYMHHSSQPLPFRLLTFFFREDSSPFDDPRPVIRTYCRPEENSAKAWYGRQLCALPECVLPLLGAADCEREDCDADPWLELYPQHDLVDGDPFEDLPTLEDLELLTAGEFDARAAGKEILARRESQQVAEFNASRRMARTQLFGYPRWCNAHHHALCRRCDRLMYQLVQIDQTDVRGLYLGAGALGLGHLFWCPEHPTVFQTYRSVLS